MIGVCSDFVREFQMLRVVLDVGVPQYFLFNRTERVPSQQQIKATIIARAQHADRHKRDNSHQGDANGYFYSLLKASRNVWATICWYVQKQAE